MSHSFKSLIFLVFIVFGVSLLAADAHENLKWSQREVSVCWGDSKVLEEVFDPLISISGEDRLEIADVDLSTKAKIKNLVNLHYSKEITGIYFSGWDSCLPMDRSVKIFYFDEYGESFKKLDKLTFGLISRLMDSFLGISSIGNGAFADINMEESGKPGSQALILRTLNPGTILHEFGHLSGLRHEHTKIEVQHGEICAEYKNIINENYEFSFEKKRGATTYTIADDYSIMSYCYIKLWKGLNKVKSFDLSERLDLPIKEYIVQQNDKYHYRVLLSPSDIHSLRCLYTKDNEEHYCRYHNANQDKFTMRVYKKYLKNITSSESQNIYEYEND